MSKKEGLQTLTPRMAFEPYREILWQLWLLGSKEKYFTAGKLSREITEFESRTGRSVTDSLEVLHETLEKLVEANLLDLNKGRYKVKASYYRFWYLIQQVGHSVEKIIRWAIYYLIAHGKCSFSIDDLFDVLPTINSSTLERWLPNLSLWIDEGDQPKRKEPVVERHNGKWVISRLPKSWASLNRPIITNSVDNKLLCGILEISHLKSEFTTDELYSCIRRLEGESVEAMLRKLGMKRDADKWKASEDIANNPELLVEQLEGPLKRQRYEVPNACITLLEEREYTVTELTELLNADKSTVSKALKRLRDLKYVKTTRTLPDDLRRVYQLTDCDNCPYRLDKESCKAMLIEKIEKTMGELGIPIPDVSWEDFQNQVLRRFLNVVMNTKFDKSDKSTVREFQELCDKAFSRLLPHVDAVEKGSLPYLYRLGVKHAQEHIKRSSN